MRSAKRFAIIVRLFLYCIVTDTVQNHSQDLSLENLGSSGEDFTVRDLSTCSRQPEKPLNQKEAQQTAPQNLFLEEQVLVRSKVWDPVKTWNVTDAVQKQSGQDPPASPSDTLLLPPLASLHSTNVCDTFLSLSLL